MKNTLPFEIISELIHKNGNFPNNSKLPFVFYKNVLKFLEISDSQSLSSRFLQNGWKNSWINGIYPYHHYHSNTHEVLGITKGRCKVQIGGENGPTFKIEKGDVLILPAGMSHKNLDSSKDFECVGAYPSDIQYDMNYGKPDENPRIEMVIKKVPLPTADPLYGKDGPLFQYWK